MRIIFATTNEDKMKEIREILGDLGMQILSLKEAGIQVLVLIFSLFSLNASITNEVNGVGQKKQ